MIMANKSQKDIERSLKVRAKVASERPDFQRSEANRFPRLGDKWRSSKGIRSKMRLKKRSRSAIVETGYRGPVATRGLHPTGKNEVLVHNVSELEGINPETQVVRISSSSGKMKRLAIKKRADELKIVVLNIRPSDVPKPEEAPEEAVVGETEESEASESESDEQEEGGAGEEEPEEAEEAEEAEEEPNDEESEGANDEEADRK